VSVFWVPRRSYVCDYILESEGVIGEITSSEFPLYFLSLENDLISLQLESSFEDIYLVSVVSLFEACSNFNFSIRTPQLYTSPQKL
jgi:hypothetical protein